MKKYFAREVRSDYIDVEPYFSEEDAVERNIWIGGNRDFVSINAALVTDVEAAFEKIDSDVDYETGYDTQVELDAKTKRDLVENYFTKTSGAFSDEEIAKIITTATEYQGHYFSDSSARQLMCDVLSIIYGKQFACTTLRGCSQGDWIYCIYPQETVSKEDLDYIEAVFFGTGTEFAVTSKPIDSAADFDDAEVYYTYTDKYHDEDIKTFIANDIGCSPKDVVLLLISGEHRTITYDYEEK